MATKSEDKPKCLEIYDVPLPEDGPEGFYQEQCWLPAKHKGDHAPATQDQRDALMAEHADPVE